MKKEQWIDKLHVRMAEYEEPAPEGLWDDIESALQQPAVRRRARTVALRRWAAAAVAALLLGGVGVVYFSGSESSVSTTMESVSDERGLAEDSQHQAEETQHQAEESRYLSKISHSEYKGTATHSRSSVPSSNTSLPPADIPLPPADTLSSPADNSLPLADNSIPPTDNSLSSEDASVHTQHPSPITQHPSPNTPHPTFNPQISPSKSQSSKLSVGLLASNLWAGDMGGSTSSQPVGMAMAAPAAFFNGSNDEFIKNIGTNFKSFNDIASSLGGNYRLEKANGSSYLMALPEYDEKVSHSMPFTVGVSLNYSLSERWALISGLVYSRLASEFTRHIGYTVLTDKQTLHYIGLPLKASYRLWGNRQLATYVQAGGQLDVNVGARLNSEGLERNIPKDRLQFSLLGNVGIEYHFLPSLGVYLEPGLRYYFNNGSSVENIFKETPLNYDLQFGFRLHLK